MSDDVQRIAGAIARLSAEEKAHLFELLAARGEMPREQERRRSEPPQVVVDRPDRESPPEPDYILVFDGGSKGNPGWGYGSYNITRVADGAQRTERVEFGDGYTNNEAEYDTLIVALKDLAGRIEVADRQPGEFHLEVRGDSALVINQIEGRWKASEPRMVERRDRARALLDRFAGADLIAQPREESVRVLGH